MRGGGHMFKIILMRGTSQHGGVPRHRSIFRKTHTLNNNFWWIKRLKYCWLFFRPFLRFFFFFGPIKAKYLDLWWSFPLEVNLLLLFHGDKKNDKKINYFLWNIILSTRNVCFQRANEMAINRVWCKCI